MPIPGVVLGEHGRAAMLEGFTSMGRLLAMTLGPSVGTIANDRHPNQAPELLTDAATIARRIIQLPERGKDAGAMMMRHLVWRMREEVGDGSATAAAFADALAREMEKVINAGANAMMVRHGVEAAVDAAVEAIDAMAIPLDNEETIAAVATAATGDAEIGKILGEMYDVLGPNANIIITGYIATYHDRAYHDGARFKGGYVSPYLLTDEVRRVAILENAHVLVTDQVMDTAESASKVLDAVVRRGGKAVLIICKRMGDKAIGVLTANNDRGTIQSCAATIKAYGDPRPEVLNDLAILTGGQPLISPDDRELPELSPALFGQADRVLVDRERIDIVGGKGDRARINERVKGLRRRLREAKANEDREAIRDLLAHFSAGIGELRIGAVTEDDRKALKAQAEESMKAVMCGMEGGVVPGGGSAYLNCIPAVQALDLHGDAAIGAQIVARVLEAPMRIIATNAGEHPPIIIDAARRAGPGWGFDAKTNEIADMAERGVMDPAMVVKHALRLGASGALMLMTTDALVLHRKPKEDFKP
ncbi:MAG: chaperonin GroEL [Anaerolineae bacterium]|jgi:chaperonin GroEL